MHFSKIFVPIALGLGVFCADAFAVESYEWGNVRFDGGGFVSSVIFHPTAKNLLYARTDVGGIYRYDFSTQHWIPLMDFISENDKGLYGTESFALDPTDPTRIYVLAGTGYFSDGRTAIFRSTDQGANWDTTYVEMLAHGNGMGRQTGEKLAVDPNMPNIILCGSRTKGVYKSTDYGKTWTSLYKVALSDATGNSLTNVNGVSFVIFDASQGKLADGSTKTIYLGLSETADNLQVSQDGGKTWNTIKGGPAGLMPHRAKIVNGNMYITFADGPGPHSITKGAVYKLNLASNTWTDITPSDGSEKDNSSYGGIAIDPTDEKHLVVSTLGKYTGRHLAANGKDNYGDRIYVSTDGGKSWIHGQHYDDGTNIDENGTLWIPGNAIHWAGSLEFNPQNPKEVWVTSGNGIFQTDDITKKVPLWKFQSRGIEETVPLDIVSIPDGPLVTAIGDYDGGVYTDINSPVIRHSPTVGTTESMGYAAQTGTLVRTGVVTVYGQYESINYNKMYRSDDFGATWDLIGTPKGAKGLVVLSSDGKVILHRPEQSAQVYRSDDNGKTWTTIETGEQTQYARIVADPVDADVFYVMNSMGRLYVSTDAGKTFTEAANRLQNESAGVYYNGSGLIRTVPKREGHLWVPMDQAQVWLAKGYSENGLAYTEDGGASWNKCEGVSTAIAVGLGKAKEGEDYEAIYIWGIAGGADNPLGIYRSTDKGKTWDRINDDKHQFGGPGNGNFVVGDFNHFGAVYMSTVGRGLIVGAPKGSILPIPTTMRSQFSIAMQLNGRNLMVNAPANSTLKLFGVNGKLCLQEKVGANSSVSLEKIPAGKWMAKVVSSQGKTLSSTALVVK
ncbi:MAG: 1,4-beta-glucanase [Hallerella porci]|uniref:VPS10 domain-containing protein n=1 Tax=Hallerella TaxID=2815788 RepID=UPI00258BEAAC|nr:MULTISPECIES: 1,4-beta-glucanase [Hallerella]MCI5601062.1 1,4-beta-glucanase [Hallerella sp.]MDY3921385.1 1,4-beta-glucanase [Hallerella porci]